MLYGIDASRYQEWIDWKKVKHSGVSFALLKATENISYTDPTFEDNVKGAVDQGIIPGSYHFFLPQADPLLQARHYAEVINAAFSSHPCLPPCIDLETSGLGRTGLNQAIRSFLQELTRLTGRRAMIYTSPGFWSTYLPVPVISQGHLTRCDVDWAASYPLWLAHYTTGWPSQVYPWAGWTFWQYSSSGKIPGVSTRVDMNLFKGTLDDLTHLAEEE